jgi:hypothetical protein
MQMGMGFLTMLTAAACIGNLAKLEFRRKAIGFSTL